MDIKINTILESMEEYLENKSTLMFTKNVMVNRDELLDYIRNIRTELPKSLTQATIIYEDREKILSDAALRAEENIRSSENRAAEIIDDANSKASAMIEQHEITRKAKLRAQEIIDKAENEANNIMADCKAETDRMRKDTFDFVEEKISKLEKTFAHAKYNVDYLKDEFNKNSASLFHILSSNIDKEFEAIADNKKAFSLFRGELDGTEVNIDSEE